MRQLVDLRKVGLSRLPARKPALLTARKTRGTNVPLAPTFPNEVDEHQAKKRKMEDTDTPSTPQHDLIDVNMDGADPVRVTSPLESSQDILPPPSPPPAFSQPPRKNLVSDIQGFRRLDNFMKPNRTKANQTQQHGQGGSLPDSEGVQVAVIPDHASASMPLTNALGTKGEDPVPCEVIYISSSDESKVSSHYSTPGRKSLFPDKDTSSRRSGMQRHVYRDIGSSRAPKKIDPEVIHIDDDSPTEAHRKGNADLFTPLLEQIGGTGNEGSREKDQQVNEKSPYFAHSVTRHGLHSKALEDHDFAIVSAQHAQESLTRQSRHAGLNSDRLRQLRQNFKESRTALTNVERGRPSSPDDNSLDELQGPVTVGSHIETHTHGTNGRVWEPPRRNESEGPYEIPDFSEQEGPKSASDIPTTAFSSGVKRRTSKAKATNVKESNFTLKSLTASHHQVPLRGPDLKIVYASESKTFQVSNQGRLVLLDPELTFDKLQGCIWSADKDGALARLTGSRINAQNLWFHLEFLDLQSVKDFAGIAEKQLRRVQMKKGFELAQIFNGHTPQLISHRIELRKYIDKTQNQQPSQLSPNSLMDSKEFRLLEQRTSSARRPSPARRSTLVSQLQAEAIQLDEHEPSRSRHYFRDVGRRRSRSRDGDRRRSRSRDGDRQRSRSRDRGRRREGMYGASRFEGVDRRRSYFREQRMGRSRSRDGYRQRRWSRDCHNRRPRDEPRIRYMDDRADRHVEETRSRRMRDDTAGIQTRRMTRHDRSPESAANEVPTSERYSMKYGLGAEWDDPIVYPPGAKKQITVYQENLRALDEGQWLNDNIIEFYILWLQERMKIQERQMYVFPTQFYTRLTERDPKQPGERINFANVERWTTRAKVDIFTYDFVVIPINDSAHWYLAIVCNLPNLKRKLALEGDTADQNAKGARHDSIPDGKRNDVNVASTRRTDHRQELDDRGLSDQYSHMTIGDELWAAAKFGDHPLGTDAMELDNEDVKPYLPAANRRSPPPSVRPGTPMTPSTTGSQKTVSSAIGVFKGAKASPTMTNKSRRKSGPGRRKYDPDLPAIVILDSLHSDHHQAISHIKDYLILEASSKRRLQISRADLQGMHVKEGIPAQNNMNDCGLYVLGFIQKFMDNPKEFGRKCLRNDFDLETDWPNMIPNEMRSWIRTELFRIHDEQKMAKEEKRRNKKAAKRAERQAAGQSSPGKDAVPATPPDQTASKKRPNLQLAVETSAVQATVTSAPHPRVVIDAPAAPARQVSPPTKQSSAREVQPKKDTTSATSAPTTCPPVVTLKGATEDNQQNSDVMLLDEEPPSNVFSTERDSSESLTTTVGNANSRATLGTLGFKLRPAQGNLDPGGADEPFTTETSRPKTRGKQL